MSNNELMAQFVIHHSAFIIRHYAPFSVLLPTYIPSSMASTSFRLSKHLRSRNNWQLIETDTDPSQSERSRDSLFMVGNGYLGYRGTLAEAGQAQQVSCIVSDSHNTTEGHTALCNVPNPLSLTLVVNGQEISGYAMQPKAHERSIDLRDGLFHRVSSYQIPDGTTLHIAEERFASYYDLHLLAMQYRFSVDKAVTVQVFTGIDSEIHDPYVPNLEQLIASEEKGIIALEATTTQSDIRIAVAEGIVIEGAEPTSQSTMIGGETAMRSYTFELEAGQEVIIEKLCSIYHSNDTARLAERPRYQGTQDPLVATRQDIEDCLDSGYLYAKQVHQEQWVRTWEASDIQLEGDPALQIALRFCLFHLLIASPAHGPIAVGPFGLSGQATSSEHGWNPKHSVLPLLQSTQPRLAQNLMAALTADLDEQPTQTAIHDWLETGALDKAYRYSHERLTHQLYPQSDSPKGIALANCGEAWSLIIEGFAGVAIHNNRLVLNSRLPEHWTSLIFNMYINGQRVHILINHASVQLKTSVLNLEEIDVSVWGQEFRLGPDQEKEITA